MAEQADTGSAVTPDAWRWNVRRTPAAWASVAAPAGLLLTVLLLASRWLSLPVGLPALAAAVGTLGAMAATVWAAVRAYACLTLHYIVDHDTLTIVWGTARWVVPLRHLLAGSEPVSEDGAPAGEQAVLVDGTLAPGFQIGRGYIKDAGPALFFTTLPADASLVLRTAQCRYLLSPENPLEFLACVQERIAGAGPAVASEPGPGLASVLRRPVVAGLVALAALAVFLNLALYAYITWWYPVLPAQMPVDFTALGAAGRWAPAMTLFRLPAIGTIIAVADTLLSLLPHVRRQPVAGYALMAAAVVAQLLLWVAFLLLLP